MTSNKTIMTVVIGTYLVGFLTLGYFSWRMMLWANWHYGYEQRVEQLVTSKCEMKK